MIFLRFIRSEGRRFFRAAALTLLVGVLPGGCGEAWRPELHPADSASRPSRDITPADCLRAARRGTWVYQRKELSPSTAPAEGEVTEYVRVVEPEMMIEGEPGVIADPLGLKLLSALDEDAPTTQPAAAPAPEDDPHARGWGVYRITIKQPMDPLPPELAEQGQITQESPVIYGRAGQWAFWKRGTLTRTALIEGFEDIECPAGRFPRCLRVRVDLNIHFPLTPIITLTAYLWLSPEAGEVRRVQRLEGVILVFWFASAYEYTLTAYQREASAPAGDIEQCWSRMTVILDRGVPRPRIAAMSATLISTRPAD